MSLVETHAISSDLTGEAAAQVAAVWRAWREKFGIKAASDAINPHLTWVIGELDADVVIPRLTTIAAATVPVEIRFGAVKSFDCGLPVVYLEVHESPALRRLHGQLADLAVQAGVKIWKYYDPETWVPHITLGLRDIAPGQIAQLVEEASARPWIGRTVLDRLALVHLSTLQGHRRDHTYRKIWPLGRTGDAAPEGAPHAVRGG